ncbi:MAG: serine/threonine protein kinase [Akkermansia sp.]|nr:serine/threonine protein kinase [Akkermansia sp.]
MDDAEKEELVAAVVDEYLEAFRRGEAPEIADVVALHPECRDELNELLPALLEMEGVSRTATRTVRDVAASYPQTLGGYRLLERLGHGGMGTVFRAEHVALHREVAIKILFPSWSAEKRHCEAFEKESRVIAGLHHTNIVEVFGAGHEGNFRYYVMSLVKGKGVSVAALRTAYPGVDFNVAVARVGLQAANALAYAHSQGVLHRDVKPGNLLLDAEGTLYVGDFGLATVLNHGEDAPLVTQSHDGTLRYMAPERLSRGVNSFAADQYGLGLTLYELLTGKAAFREIEPGNLIHRICSEPLPPLQGLGELGAIINKSIAFDPADRYADMGEMAADIQRFLKGEPVKARPVSLLRRYIMWMKRRPAVALWSHLAAGLVVLLLASISWGYANENKQRRRAEENAQIADAALKRIFNGMLSTDSEGQELLQVTRADARLLRDLMPYYEQIASQAAGGGADMGSACCTLATIALQTGDADTAQQYFRLALEKLPESSVEYARSVNGLAMCLWTDRHKRDEARQLLQRFSERISAGKTEFGVRVEQVRALLMLADPSRRFRHFRHSSSAEAEEERRQRRENYMQQAVKLIAGLVEENPAHEQSRLFQLLLLEQLPPGDMRNILAPHGEQFSSLLEDLLRRNPDSRAYRRAYVQHCLRRRGKGEHAESEMAATARAVEYAQGLLAESPSDSNLLLMYLAIRDRYALMLNKQGRDLEAMVFNEKTLGVLSLLTSRADFTPEMREQLVMLVSAHPTEDEARAQQEAEISLLLQSYDEQRMQEIRTRIRRMRLHRSPRKRPQLPPPHAQPLF